MKSGDVRRISQRSFVTGGIVALLIASAFVWVKQQPENAGIPRFLRSVHEFNGGLWGLVYSPKRLPPVKGAPAGTRPRVNGDVGLRTPVDLRKWRLQVYVEDKPVQALSLGALKWLPRTSTATEFYCIEGWNTQFSYAGVKFSDFMKAFDLSDHYRYVGLETPDGEYYVSIDMDSMLHSQTLLATEMNEQPLSIENGAPLRLIIPIKYGIKSLKRIGTIRFSNSRLPDYWAERGYDWYSGL